MDLKRLEERTFELFRELVATDTSNPPGNESRAAEVLARFLEEGGVSSQIVEKVSGRSNLVACLEGRSGPKERLVLSGHFDVVPTEGQTWSVDPFAAEVRDGFLYGRGTVDMKHMVAMSAGVVRALAESGRPLRHGLVLAVVADEEVGGDVGAAYLVDSHPDLVTGRYYLGEVGGFTMRLGQATIMPIQVAERGRAVLRLTAEGPSGHGSLPAPKSALARLARAVDKLTRTPFPVHHTEAAQAFLEQAARLVGPVQGPVFKALAMPATADVALRALRRLLPGKAVLFQAILTNTAVPTVVHAGSSTNVVPPRAEALVDGRYLPGQTAQDLAAEVQAVVGRDIQVEILSDAPPVEVRPYRTPFYELLWDHVRRQWPDVWPVPTLTPGYTDAKHFQKVGLACYGFTPVRMPDDLVFSELFHAPDERIPVQGFRDGFRLLLRVVEAYCCEAD